MSGAEERPRQPELAIFIPSFGAGGVDRMLVNIAGGIAARGIPVDFIVSGRDGPYLAGLDDRVNCLELAAQEDDELTDALYRYVQAQRPRVVMTGKGRDDLIALRVRERLGGAGTRFVLRVGTAVSGRAAVKMALPWQRRRYRRRLHAMYASCDGVLANSRAVADEIAEAAGIPRERVSIVPNPTVTPELIRRAAEPPEHPWLQVEDGPPVILGIGGLRTQKDFSTLVRAFARLRRDRPARLLILGEGRQRRRLERLARRLGVAADVALPGFSANPYAALAHAALFVLSSRWEGLPNVLIEALAVGTPAVATDAPGGAAEILDGGRYGPLVPPGEPAALAEAMVRSLDRPPSAAVLREAARRYTLEVATDAYISALGLVPARS